MLLLKRAVTCTPAHVTGVCGPLVMTLRRLTPTWAGTDLGGNRPGGEQTWAGTDLGGNSGSRCLSPRPPVPACGVAPAAGDYSSPVTQHVSARTRTGAWPTRWFGQSPWFGGTKQSVVASRGGGSAWGWGDSGKLSIDRWAGFREVAGWWGPSGLRA